MAKVIETRAVVSAQDRTGTTFAAVAQKLKQLESVSARTGAGVAARINAASRIASAIPAVLAGGAVAAGAKAAIGDFVDLEKKMTSLAVTAGMSVEEQRVALASLQQQARQYRATATEMVEGAEVFVAAGLDMKAAIAAVGPSMQVAKTYGASIGEVANAGVAGMKNLKIGAEDLKEAFGILALADKEGAFRMADFARELPAVGAAAAAVGLKGKKGLAEIAAQLEIMRDAAGSSSEAANRAQQFFLNLNSPERRKRFKDAGIDLSKVFAEGAKQGLSASEAVFKTLRDATLKMNEDQRDVFMGSIFTDSGEKQFATQMVREYERLIATIAKLRAGGGIEIIDKDSARVAETAASRLDVLGKKLDELKVKAGEALAPLGIGALEKGAAAIEGIGSAAQSTGAQVGRDTSLISAALVSAADDIKKFASAWTTSGTIAGPRVQPPIFGRQSFERISSPGAGVSGYHPRYGTPLPGLGETKAGAFGLKGAQGQAGPAFPKMLPPEQKVDVSVEGQAEVGVTVAPIRIEAGSELIRVVSEAKEATAQARMALRQANSSGPGSTGKTMGSTGSQGAGEP